VTTYKVNVTREDNSWVAIADGVPGAAADDEHFDELAVDIRDAIGFLTNSDRDSFDIAWNVNLGGRDLSTDLNAAWDAEHRRAALEAERDVARKRAIDQMRKAGISFRQIGEVLGVSHQRVQQIASGREQNQAIREWAEKQGIEPSQRGRQRVG
jgi:hypothetical protein